MLSVLRIRNLALVDHLEWHPGTGFVAITGETGAGKSVIIGALQLLLGERADRSLVRSGEKSCVVEGVLRLAESRALDSWLEEQGLEPCEDGELILKRVVEVSGSNKQFINCGATTLSVLKKLGERLVDLHGPHDHQSLFSVSSQMAVLDSFAGTESELDEYRKLWQQGRQLQADFDELSRSEAELEREIDLLRHQLGEIEALELSPADEDELEQRYVQASNSRRLIELASKAAEILDGEEGSVAGSLAEVQRSMSELARLDQTAGQLAERHESALIEIGQLAAELADYAQSLDIDPAQLAEIEERMNAVQTVKRKYGGSVAAAIAFAEQARQRLDKIEGRGAELARLTVELDECNSRRAQLAGQLGSKRQEAAGVLAGNVREQLARLGFARAGFEIQIEQRSEPGPDGCEQVEFQFAPNIGEPSRPLRDIASSGEISRVMLALKSAIAGRVGVPILVFDEIDANIGGEVAHAVGEVMAELAGCRQILCITHLPQVAARANDHFQVSKAVSDGRTVTSLMVLDDAMREQELARMLGGGEAALTHARGMLERSGTGKRA